VINLSDTHRNILDALYELRDESPLRGGFTTREVASKAGCSPQTVSNNKAFLSMSAKLIKETEDGISLLPGADPEEWRSGDLTKGLPSPEKVRTWWEEQNPPPDSPDGHKTTGQAGQGAETGDKADTYAENPVQGVAGQALDTSILLRGDALDPTGRVQPLSKEALGSENGISKPNTGHIEGLSSVSSDSQGSSGKENGRRRLTPEQVQRYNRLKAEGMMSELALAAVRGEKMEL
jgi:hypothetical protein